MAGDAGAQLAAWTSLSADRFSYAYTVQRDRQKSRAWKVLERDVQRANNQAREADVIRAACAEALTFGFIEALARSVGDMESDHTDRDPLEIGQMLSMLASSGIMQAMTDPAKGLMDARIFRALDLASQACALVAQGGQPVGTSFLVAPDLVMTAAHVVLEHDTGPGGRPEWRDRLKADLTFSFAPDPRDPAGQRMVIAALPGQRLNSFAYPHGRPPNILDAGLADPACDRLDFALVRLARQVRHLPPIDITRPGEDIFGRACFVIGYPGGTALKFDAETVTTFDQRSGRLIHLANTVGGMSGACCIGAEGLIVGLHEGSLPVLDESGRPQRKNGKDLLNNRGISMLAIRARQCQGPDPLTARRMTQGLELFDPALVEGLYKNGLRLVGEPLADAWRTLVQGLLGLPAPPGDGVPMPSFHPWFQRRDVERWIDDRTPGARVCHVFGGEGVGKSFCVEILRAKLAEPAVDLFTVNATQTTVLSWEDAIGRALDTGGLVARTGAGAVRYDDIPGIIELLSAGRSGRRSSDRPLFVAMDFGHDGGNSLAAPEWQMLVDALAREQWVRLMLIGLDLENRAAVDDRLASHSLSQDVQTEPFDLKPLGETDLARYARALSVARGKPMSPQDASVSAAKLWALPIMLHTKHARPELQTSEAVLAAMALERTLGE